MRESKRKQGEKNKKGTETRVCQEKRKQWWGQKKTDN